MPRAKQRAAKVVLVEPALVEFTPKPEANGSLFEDLDDEDGLVVAPRTIEADDIPPLDEGLTPDEKAEFISLLNKEMPLKDRAKQLGVLARKEGQKTAAVGLRAIIEINEITGLRKEKATETSPMFQLPSNANVSVHITKVEK